MYNYSQMIREPKGDQAARARQRKFELIRRLVLPEKALPGSLALTHRRCGKPTCHCAKGEGHPIWLLTYMVDGKKHVEAVPMEWVEEVRERVEVGRAFKQDVTEVLNANAELLVLARRQRRK